MNKKGLILGVGLVMLLAVLPAFGNVVSTTGDVVEITYMDLAPAFSVQMDAFESNDSVFLLQEKEAAIALDAPALNVSHLVDSDLDDDTNLLETGFFSLADELTSGIIPENTEVNTYLLHFDTVGDDQVRITGSITFDERILGLIVTETELEETDATYGQEFVLYPPDTEDTVETHRGLELEGPDGDWFVVSQDARTLTFSFVSKNRMDQVRIVTEDAADGPPVATNCQGLGEAELDIIPGNRDNIVFADSTGKITVALFSRLDFDATACVAIAEDTLTFGRTGDELSYNTCGFEDFNLDGFDDLICDFNAEDANFQIGDTEGILRANLVQLDVEHLQNVDDFRLEYRDSVTVMEASSQSVNCCAAAQVKAQRVGNSIFFSVQGSSAESHSIEIYNTQGALVFEQSSSAGNVLRWNTQSSTGQQLANGVYFYVITAKNGSNELGRSIGKIAVIR